MAEEGSSSGENKPAWKGVIKKAVITTGKSIARGTKLVAETTKRKMEEASADRQKRREIANFKEKILRRLYESKLKQLCHEHSIPITVKKTKLVQSRSGKFYTKRYTHKYNFDELVKILRKNISLDDITKFAKRNHVNIRDVLTEIEQRQAEEEIKEFEEAGISIDEFFSQVVETIKSFKPFRRYTEELPYQIDLARWLHGRFPRTKIEETRGSTRPDIVIKGIAIEVKGPTYDRDLQTIADKCIRYRQYYPKGMIVVLFNINVNQYRYNDWLNGMKNNFPDVFIIRKN